MGKREAQDKAWERRRGSQRKRGKGHKDRMSSKQGGGLRGMRNRPGLHEMGGQMGHKHQESGIIKARRL